MEYPSCQHIEQYLVPGKRCHLVGIGAYLAAPDTGRAAACRSMLQTISDTAPIVPICFEKHCLYVHRGAVGGFSPTKYNIFRNITDWKISQA